MSLGLRILRKDSIISRKRPFGWCFSNHRNLSLLPFTKNELQYDLCRKVRSELKFAGISATYSYVEHTTSSESQCSKKSIADLIKSKPAAMDGRLVQFPIVGESRERVSGVFDVTVCCSVCNVMLLTFPRSSLFSAAAAPSPPHRRALHFCAGVMLPYRICIFIDLSLHRSTTVILRSLPHLHAYPCVLWRVSSMRLIF